MVLCGLQFGSCPQTPTPELYGICNHHSYIVTAIIVAVVGDTCGLEVGCSQPLKVKAGSQPLTATSDDMQFSFCS